MTETKKTPSLQDLNLTVEVKTLPAIHVAKVRHVGPYEKCEPAFETLCGWAAPKGLLNPSTQVFGISYDDPRTTAPEKIRYDACITVPEGTPLEAPIEELIIPEGDYACATYKGPCSGIAAAYAALESEGLKIIGREYSYEPCVELYLSDPSTTPEEEQLTEIRLPLK